MNIGVYIENGGINTLNIGDSVIDQLAAIDQAESHFRSENIKFGIRHRMRNEEAQKELLDAFILCTCH